MNLLYSKTKVELQAKIDSSQEKEIIKNCLQKLREGFPEKELYGVLRSYVYATSGNKQTYGSHQRHLLLGINWDNHCLSYRVLEVGFSYHRLVAKEFKLDDAINKGNKYLSNLKKEKEYLVTDEDFGVASFTEDSFYQNLDSLLKDADAFYQEKDAGSDYDPLFLNYYNGRISYQSSQSLERVQELEQKDITEWLNDLENAKNLSEEEWVDFSAYALQNPFFKETLSKEEQAKLRQRIYKKRIEENNDNFSLHNPEWQKISKLYQGLLKEEMPEHVRNYYVKKAQETSEKRLQKAYQMLNEGGQTHPYLLPHDSAAAEFSFKGVCAEEIIKRMNYVALDPFSQDRYLYRLFKIVTGEPGRKVLKKYKNKNEGRNKKAIRAWEKFEKAKTKRLPTFFLYQQVNYKKLTSVVFAYLNDDEEEGLQEYMQKKLQECLRDF